jgi:transcriptional regulator with XRE-family HTH domain
MRGFYIRQLRRRLRLTQEQLAERSGVAQNTISKLETTAVAPTYAVVLAVARALRVDPQSLRFGPEPVRVRRQTTVSTETGRVSD